MKYIVIGFICGIVLMISCQDIGKNKTESLLQSNIEKEIIVNEGASIYSRYQVPIGFVRTSVAENSFGKYLREFPLLPVGEEVHLFDGTLKYNQDVHSAILDIDVGGRDLQQCADAVMRLRSEYLYENQRYDKIAFNFTNGWKFEYQKWRDGNDLVVNGNKTGWVPGKGKKENYEDFRKYLDHVFMYAGTLSLSKELKSKSLEAIELGDVIIKGGSPGHAVIVVDMCVNTETGDKAFLLAQSYMPAQQIHVLKNPNASNNSSWYLLSQIENQIITPEWTFDRNQLMSF